MSNVAQGPLVCIGTNQRKRLDYLWTANAKIYNDSVIDVIVLWVWIINEVLHTLLCWTMLIVVVFFWWTMGSEYTGKTNLICRFVCLRKSYSNQGLSVMGLDMGTINSFCLVDGVASVKFYSCEAVIIDERYLICVYQQRIQWRFSLEFWEVTEGIYSLTEILND